jgi:hypothetical protein
MSAEFVDALKGYEYYLKERGEATIDDVNNYLVTHGRRPIQARTYNHYRKLLAHGFRSYIPINQFDVFQALGKIQMAADRRRYHRDKIQTSAKVSYDGETWKDALVIDKSLVGFGVTVFKNFPVSKGTQIWIRLDDYDDIPVILVWRRHNQDNSTNLGVRAFEFIASYHLTGEDLNVSRLTDVLQISREDEGILDWEHIYRVFDKTNQLLDAVSALIYSINDVLDSKVHLARPILESVKFGSPGELQTKVDLGVADIVRVVLEKIQYWSLDRKKRELENANLGIEIIRNAIHLRKELKKAVEADLADEVIAALFEPIRSLFDVNKLPKGLFDEGTPERGVLIERVIPVVTELVAGDDPSFKISVYKASRSRQDVIPPQRKRRRTNR